MTNQSLRSLAISLAALGLLAGPAWSARVVEVRVGDHPTFTRVVFELDAKAGYEIERRAVEGGQELVVTLSAASQPRKITSRSPMIAGVEVEPRGTDAVARVRLRRAAPLVKELILTSPPRIVLDLMLPDDLARAAAVPKAKAKAKAKPEPGDADTAKTTSGSSKPEEPREVADATAAARPEAPKPAPEVERAAPKAPVAAPKATRPPEVDAGPEPKKPSRTVEAPKAPKPLETAAAPKAPESKAPEAKAPESGARGSEAPEKPATAPPAQAIPTPPAMSPAPTPGARIETALEGERVVAPKPVGSGDVETGGEPSKPLPPVARPRETAPQKPAAKAPEAATPTAAKPGWGLFGLRLHSSDPWLTFAIVGACAFFFLVVVALLLRKHSRHTSLDALESTREPQDAGGSFDDAESAAGAGAGLGTQHETFPSAGRRLFDDDSEKGDMDMAAQIPIEREQRARMTQTPAGADSDAGPLLRELERRMTQLESRLDQANEARERLERQVTAQSEELRVQRAAIARTQRALRGMSRGGEEATEPALRDPSKPPPGRA